MQLLRLQSVGGEFAQYEFLNYPAQYTLSGIDGKLPQNHSCSPVRVWIVGVHESGGRQVTSHARVIHLPLAIVAPANERTGHGMLQARCCRSRALIEIARILMQNRREDSAADQNVAHSVRRFCAKTLAVSFGALYIVRAIRGLFDAGHECHSRYCNRISGDLHRELKLQLCGEW